MKSNRKIKVIERKLPPRPFFWPKHGSVPVTLGSYPIVSQYCPKKEGTRNRSCELHPGILLDHFPRPPHVPSLTAAATLRLTLCFPHGQHHTALGWHSRTWSSPWGPHSLSTTSRRLVTDPETISLGLGESYLEELCKWMNFVFPPSLVHINDPHSISLPFPHFTCWLHLVVAHFTTSQTPLHLSRRGLTHPTVRSALQRPHAICKGGCL